MRILVAMLVFVLIFSVIFGAVILAVRQQPLPGWITALHFEMCKPPCWIGIRPGVTTLSEAVARLRSVYSASDYSIKEGAATLNNERSFHIFIKGKSAAAVTFHMLNMQVVDAIDFSFQEWREFSGEQATYADVHRFLGVPSYLSIQSWYGDTVLSYPSNDGNVNVVSLVSSDRAKWALESRNLEQRSISQLAFSKEEPLRFVGAAHLTWHGFIPLSKYRMMLCVKTGCN